MSVSAISSISLSSDIVIPAMVALVVSGLTLVVTFITSDRRARYDAAFEAAKYREKWLSGLREEIALFTSYSLLLSIEQGKDKSVVRDLMTRRLRILLAVPRSNPHYQDLSDLLDKITTNMMSAGNHEDIGKDGAELTRISKKILKAEWSDIQDLLAKGVKRKSRKENAKNQ